LKYTNMVLDPKVDNSYELISIPKEWYKMKSGEFLLWHTEEILGSTKYVPLIHNKSSIARLWLFVHITADLIDIGSIGNSTLQLYATMPIRLYSWMKIAQVSFRVPQWNIKLYEGKYQHSRWPQSSKTYKDFIQ
jgi:dCTP deaminase